MIFYAIFITYDAVSALLSTWKSTRAVSDKQNKKIDSHDKDKSVKNPVMDLFHNVSKVRTRHQLTDFNVPVLYGECYRLEIELIVNVSIRTKAAVPTFTVKLGYMLLAFLNYWAPLKLVTALYIFPPIAYE